MDVNNKASKLSELAFLVSKFPKIICLSSAYLHGSLLHIYPSRDCQEFKTYIYTVEHITSDKMRFFPAKSLIFAYLLAKAIVVALIRSVSSRRFE